MAIIPGVTGQKAELFDGAKIDAISEYTAGNGTQLQGRTSGVAIEAGKVGEVILNNTFTGLSQNSPSDNTFYEGTGSSKLSLSVTTAGVYLIDAIVYAFLNYSTNTEAGPYVYFTSKISDGTTDKIITGNTFLIETSKSNLSLQATLCPSFDVVSLTAGKTYTVSIKVNRNVGGLTYNNLAIATSSKIRAIRIA